MGTHKFITEKIPPAQHVWINTPFYISIHLSSAFNFWLQFCVLYLFSFKLPCVFSSINKCYNQSINPSRWEIIRYRCLFCSAASGLTQNGCICHLSCNYSLHVLGSIKQDLFAHDLLPHDDMRYIWLLSAVLSMLSWKELCVSHCHPHCCFLLELWENHRDQHKCTWLTSSKKLTQKKQNNVKLEQVIIQAKKPLSSLHYLV